MVDRAKILDAVKTAIEKAPKRKFSESIDITINLKNIDMAQPKNRIDETILLPERTGEKNGICVIGKGDIVTQAKEAKVDLIIGPEEVERLGGAPREARRVARSLQVLPCRDRGHAAGRTFFAVPARSAGQDADADPRADRYPPDCRTSPELGEDPYQG